MLTAPASTTTDLVMPCVATLNIDTELHLLYRMAFLLEPDHVPHPVIRCELEGTHPGRHTGLVQSWSDLSGPEYGSLFVEWDGDDGPWPLELIGFRPICPLSSEGDTTSPTDEGCVLPIAHPGRCSFEIELMAQVA